MQASIGTDRARQFWGYGHMPYDQINTQNLSNIESHLAEQVLSSKYMYAPSRFASDNYFQLMPHVPARGLPTLENTLQKYSARSSVTILPEFWHIEPLVFNSNKNCRVLHAPVSSSNILAAVEIVHQLNPEVVIASAETASALASAIKANTHVRSPRAWHVICTTETPISFFPLSGDVHLDIHVIPGISIATTCRLQKTVLHPSENFFWEAASNTSSVLITTIDGAPMPLLRYSIHARINRRACKCGQDSTVTLV